MASITANLGRGISVTGSETAQGIQYTIRLADGTTVGPLTTDQFTNLGSSSQNLPPPAFFKLTLDGKILAKSFNENDIENGSSIVLNGFQIQSYMEKNLAVDPEPDPAEDEEIENEDPETIDDPLFDDDDEELVDVSEPVDIDDDLSGPVFDEDGNIEGGIIDEPLDIDDPGDLGNFDDELDLDVELPDVDEDAPYAEGSSKGLSNSTFIAESTATAQDNANFAAFEDWRVRLTLANDAQYLYRAQEPGILAPLATTDGVVFPYTPIIAVNYAANYEPTTITHSNYKIFQYTSSSVDQISITCDFTAQDTYEANYMLAVIHFFRSMTKMFYGQDEFPRNGTPPPLCYLFGLGGFQFEAHPLAITGFSYNLPNDVDYIRTTTTITSTARYGSLQVNGNGRLPQGIQPGGIGSPPQFDNDGEGFTPSYVPTKIQLAITCLPVISRNAISNKFSLRDYATGKLLQGTKNPGGGIW